MKNERDYNVTIDNGNDKFTGGWPNANVITRHGQVCTVMST